MGLELSVIRENLDYLLWGRLAEGEPGGLVVTLALSLGAGLIAVLGGLALAAVAWVFQDWTRRALVAWADLIRAVPLVLVIFWLYFLLPVLVGEVPGWASVVAALGWFGAASVMHAVLAGLDGLARGQAEAALASGLSRAQTLRLVLLPQALPNLVPSFVGLLAALIKDTSLAWVVSTPELTTLANQVNNRTQVYPAEIFLTVAVLYLVPICALSLGLRTFEHVRARRPRG